MTCAACGHENREGARYCAGCGESLAAPAPVCPACGNENAADARFCDACGHRLGQPAAAVAPTPDPRAYTPSHLADRILAQRASLEGERKQVTVLFADVSGSMDLAESVDAEVLREIMDRFFARLCDGIHRYEGTVVQFTGDGVMALFGAPIAHEDHAARAAWAALKLRADLSDYSAELRRERGLSFSVRMGLNSGEVVVGAIGEDLRVDYTAIGHTVGLAQRMESLAEPGTAYVTERTAALLQGLFELRDLGPHTVKGVREPVGVWELAGSGRARSRLDVARARGLSRFVGREEELAVLERALERALDGQGQVVGVVGEAGVGKSRLCEEFADRCRARGLTVYGAACQSHARNVPFHAALEMMRGYFGVEDGEPPQSVRERVAGRLLLLHASLSDDLPLVFDFLGVPDLDNPAPRMDPGARQRRLLDVVRRLSRAHADREPAVSLVEDAHWIDEGSASFLEALVDAATGSRTLVVVNFRPEFRADWMASTHYHQLPVVPLGAGAIDELLVHLLGSDPSLHALTAAIRRRTGGNPFFIEELVSALVEEGALVGARGAHRLAHDLDEIAVPASVQAVLAARIDRLGERDKALLQAAAVLGKEFGEPVLERVAQVSGSELAAALRALVAADFLYERALYPEAQYAFRHPLTQEVAYGSQLSERRRQVHGSVARAMIDLYADRLDELAALIAHHWEAADETLEAARWHARSAAWSGASDFAAALAHWKRVRELAGRLPESPETNALGLAARTWQLQIGWRLGSSAEEIEEVFSEAQAFAERVGDIGSKALLLGMYGATTGLTRNMDAAARMVREAIELARQAGNVAVQVALLPPLTYALMTSGHLAEAEAELQYGRGILEAHPELRGGGPVGSTRAWTHMLGGFIHVLRGDVAAGRAQLDEALRIAGAEHDIETVGWTHQNLVLLAHVSGITDGVRAHASRCAEIAGAIGSPFSRIWSGHAAGWAALLLEDWAAAVRAFEDAIQLAEQSRTAAEAVPWMLGGMAAARVRLGDVQLGLELADRVLVLAEERGTRVVAPMGCRIVGRALLDTGDAERAAPFLHAALEHCRALGMRGEEPLVHRDLADLARAAGDEAAESRALREAAALFERNGASGHLQAIGPRVQALAV